MRKPTRAMLLQGKAEFEAIKKKKKISTDPRYTAPVTRVSARLRKVIDMPSADWEFVVFEDRSPNAFVLPGGKVGINTGLFRIIDSDALLAAVLGHEISHATSAHADERLMRGLLAIIGGAVLWKAIDENDHHSPETVLAAYAAAVYICDSLPLSRHQEFESDRMGAIFMARAGYDPRESLKLWRKLEHFHIKHGKRKPHFLRTHPPDAKRIHALLDFMPVAVHHYENTLRNSKSKTHDR
ncbi:MAG: M48 family metallopeptidase [Akkermansiaceae bacterium]